MELQVVDTAEGMSVFYEKTGELIYHKPNTQPRKKVADVTKYLGIDTKFPYQCVTEDSLLLAVEQLDAYYTNKPFVNDSFLIDSFILDGMGKQELIVLRYLAENVVAWNVYMGSAKIISEATGIGVPHVNKVLRTSKHIKTLNTNKPFRGSMVLEINPHLVWKGDLEFRDDRIQTWYSSSSPVSL